jgi:hypothetical protein
MHFPKAAIGFAFSWCASIDALLHLTRRPLRARSEQRFQCKKERGGFGRDVMDNRLIQLCRLSLSISGFRIWRCTVVVGHTGKSSGPLLACPAAGSRYKTRLPAGPSRISTGTTARNSSTTRWVCCSQPPLVCWLLFVRRSLSSRILSDSPLYLAVSFPIFLLFCTF